MAQRPGCFTDCSELFAVPACSSQSVRPLLDLRSLLLELLGELRDGYFLSGRMAGACLLFQISSAVSMVSSEPDPLETSHCSLLTYQSYVALFASQSRTGSFMTCL